MQRGFQNEKILRLAFSRSYLSFIYFIYSIVSKSLPLVIPCISFPFILKANISNRSSYLPICTFTTGNKWTGIQHSCMFADCLKIISNSCRVPSPYFSSKAPHLLRQRYLRIFPQNSLSIKYICVRPKFVPWSQIRQAVLDMTPNLYTHTFCINMRKQGASFFLKFLNFTRNDPVSSSVKWSYLIYVSKNRL